MRGIEVSTTHREASIHLLGYLTDPTEPALAAELARARHARDTRLVGMVELMEADGIPISYAEVVAQVAPGATAGRPHIADALIANGTIAHRDEAFADWLTDDSPYYVAHYAPDPLRAVELVRAAGGVPVLAHPFTRTRGPGVTDELVERLHAAGLAGLEAYHRDHGPEEVARCERLAARHGLLLTGRATTTAPASRTSLPRTRRRRRSSRRSRRSRAAPPRSCGPDRAPSPVEWALSPGGGLRRRGWGGRKCPLDGRS